MPETIDIRIREIETGEIVHTITTTKAKLERVVNGLLSRVDLDRFIVDYPEEES